MQRLSLATVLACASTLWGCFEAPRQLEQPTVEATTEALPEEVPEVSVHLAAAKPSVKPMPRVTAKLKVMGGTEASRTIRQTPSLDFEATVTNLRGAAQLGLVLLTPDGEPYAATQWKVDGAGEALTRAHSVPVSGTLIEDFDLHGRWTAQLSLNGEMVDLIEMELQ